MIAEAHTTTNPHRPDADVAADIDTALWHDSVIRTFDRSSLKIDVRNGEVFLNGHMASMRRKQVEDIVAAIPGVVAIHNQIIDDTDLVMAVALALAKDARTEPYLIHVGAFHGWIYLSGNVPADVVPAAEEISAQVPHVRGILGVPEAPDHEHPEATLTPRQSFQPMPGSAVYADDVQVGQVTQVVINPRNKLVSHIVVQTEVDLNEQMLREQLVVPMEAIKWVKEGGGVFLKDSLAELVKRPIFMKEDFPLPSSDWQPPFPYVPDHVRWPHSTH